MERSKAPWLIIYPRIAPRRNPNPMPVAIWRPSYNGSVREPDRSVFRRAAPSAVFIKVLVTDRFVRDVSARRRMVFAAIALVGPTLQVIFIAYAFDIGVQLVRASKNAGLIGTHNVGLPAAGDFTLSIANHNNGRVARLIHINPVNART